MVMQWIMFLIMNWIVLDDFIALFYNHPLSPLNLGLGLGNFPGWVRCDSVDSASLGAANAEDNILRDDLNCFRWILLFYNRSLSFLIHELWTSKIFTIGQMWCQMGLLMQWIIFLVFKSFILMFLSCNTSLYMGLEP